MSAAETHLLTVTLTALCGWLCRALCQPPRIRFMAPEVAQRQLRVLGGHQRITRLAVILTLAAFIAVLALPARIHPDLRDLRIAAMSCGYQNAPNGAPTCYELAPGGVWVMEEVHSDGARMVVGTVTHPAFPGGCSPIGKDVYVLNEPPLLSLSFRCP